MEPRWGVLTVRQTATLLQIHDNTLYRLLEEGEIPFAIKIGGSWRIPSAPLFRWINAWPKESPGAEGSGAHRSQS